MQRWRAAKYASRCCSASVDGERLIMLSLCVAVSTCSVAVALKWRGLDWARWSGDGDARRYVAVRCCCIETKGLHVASSLSLHCSQARASSCRICMASILSATLHEPSIEGPARRRLAACVAALLMTSLADPVSSGSGACALQRVDPVGASEARAPDFRDNSTPASLASRPPSP
jgi:hypothetical protein